MPIVARSSGVTPDIASGARPSVADRAPRAGELLPSDLAPIVRTLRDHPRDAGLWGEPAFAWEVERIRRQLAPIVSRRALVSSYGREAFRGATVAAGESRSIGPVRLAYAVRWLELGERAPRPGWSGFVTDRG